MWHERAGRGKASYSRRAVHVIKGPHHFVTIRQRGLRPSLVHEGAQRTSEKLKNIDPWKTAFLLFNSRKSKVARNVDLSKDALTM